ncbi:CDP-alcohol phosphatidyltransferase family protein [Capnocytophaga felis]|uniref:CDP-alcohol phosphatidyltransferase n=1 Tax=Capnocytophaga felis TaxID=2267611 RepID=A0A5M4B6I0_9FLAO|nr:CDP-alcohol phosphatidyltransferase family protein [Capnocytophaga felis]GET44950.1 hypothetical protein RCZ01_02520 [Capnocytophaga felis]GET47887.1 hypothetical protein RCZ02_07180 [Capnocytophaga felis]
MNFPKWLILFRLLLAPTILLLVNFLKDEARSIIVILLFLGILSDIFDGIIARKMNISSVKLRRFDSQTDLIFWISAGIAAYWLESKLIKQYTIEIIILFITEGLCYAISFFRFKKETCTHAFLSKVWGICLLVAFVSLIGFSHGGFPLQLAIYWGLFSQLDVILIMLLLPKWQNDVPSAYHAYLIRKGIAFKKSKWLNDN